MEKVKIQKGFKYSDDFSNGTMVCAIDLLQKSSDSFIDSYKEFCNSLKWFIRCINYNRNSLLPSEIESLIILIENVLGSQYVDFMNTDLTFGWEEHLVALDTICFTLKNQLKDMCCGDDKISNPDINKTKYIDFANFIYRNLSTKPTYEEKKIIENKFKEFSDCFENIRGNILDDASFRIVDINKNHLFDGIIM